MKLPKYIKKQDVLARFPMRLLEFYDKNCYLIPKKWLGFPANNIIIN